MADTNLPDTPVSFSQKVADKVAKVVGSWRFIVTQSILLTIWILVNSFTQYKFDPYPFILLNLALSFQAAYTAPVIMMSNNRQEHIDRQRSIDIYNLETIQHENLANLLVHIDKHFDAIHVRIDDLQETING
jgi:uncharacterized membrane protein